MALNEESEYFEINYKNRRTMGMQYKSISFRSHERVPAMTELIIAPVQIFDKIIVLKVPLMEYLIRKLLLGETKIRDIGQMNVQKIDNEQLTMMGLLPKENPNNDQEIEKWNREHQNKFYDSQQISNYLSHLPEIISFRLKEYEKQIFYLRDWTEIKSPVIELRYLYHSGITVKDIDPYEYVNDYDLFMSLFTGLTAPIICELVQFNPVIK
jgi:hypothetical protein